MVEYQLTLQGYEEAKVSIKENLFGIGKSFVIIGWQLTRIEASGRFREDGYSSITEFAKGEYNMSADSVSKYKKVYETFSVSGDRPEIQDRYKNFEFSKLVDMRQLPEEDRSHIHPETYREDIRNLKEYNKEQENNPSRLLNWQQEQKAPEQILRDTIREYFRNKKKTLNELYASDAYASGAIKEMADIVYKDKSTFKTENAFIIFHRYPTPLFVKIGQNEAEDFRWEEFLRTMREIFDPLAAGARTYEAVFENEGQKSAQQEEKPSDLENSKANADSKLEENSNESVEKSQKTTSKSGNLQEKESYPHYDSNEVFDPTTARIVRSFLDCGYTNLLPGGTKRFRAMGAEFVAVFNPRRVGFTFYDQSGEILCYISKKRMEAEYQNFTAPAEEFAPAQQKNEILPSVGRCAYDSRKTCTLPEEYKHKPGNGENCNEKCCWNCSKRGECKLECDASAHRPEPEEGPDQIPGQDNIMNHPEYIPGETAECCQQAAEDTNERQRLLLEAWPDDLKDIPVPTLENVLRYLQKEEKNLEEMQIVAAEESGFPVNVLQKAQMNVAGLRLLRNLISTCLDSGEKAKEETPEQPPLPVMKNNDQRKEWLRNYKDWGLWYTDEHTGIRYYKYDFENGARLLAEEYDPEPESRWTQWYNPGESYYMHLIGGPEPETNGTVPKWTFHARYNKYQNSESELIEFLKALQKGKNQS